MFLAVIVIQTLREKFVFAAVSSLLLILFSLTGLAEYIFYVSLSDELFFKLLPTYPLIDLTRIISPNSFLAIFLLSLALACSCIKSKSISPSLSLLPIMAGAIGASATVGYLTNVEFAYSWGMSIQISPSTSIAFFFLSIASCLVIWTKYLNSDLTPRLIWRGITEYTTAGIMAVAVASAGFAVLPFFDHLYEERIERIQGLSRGKAILIESFFKSNENIIREYIKPAHQGKEDAIVEYSENFAGYMLLDSAGSSISRFGINPSPTVIKNAIIQNAFTLSSQNISIYGPTEIENTYYLLGIAPIYKDQKKHYSIFTIKTTILENILAIAYSKTRSDTDVFFSRYVDGEQLLFKNKYDDPFPHWQFKRVTNRNDILIEQKTKGHVFTPSRTSLLPFYGYSVLNSKLNYRVIVSSNIKDLYDDAKRPLIEFILTAITLALLGSLGGFILVKVLTERGEKAELLHEKYSLQVHNSLKEKEVLLQEIHHRVKNNLQVIISLLGLQSRKIKDKKISDAFGASENRIRSIALFHELLYGTKDFRNISLQLYFTNLTAHLVKFYQVSNKIEVLVDCKDFRINLDRGVSCGLIVSELVTNSIKHAFPKCNNPKISIILNQTNQNHYQLIISDNGVGFEYEKAINHESLGTKLVDRLIQQIDGTFEFSSANGSNYIITFPITEEDQNESV